MSRSYEYTYALERARRQAIYNERVSATTERYYQKYMSQYNEMMSRGYSGYIPKEMTRLQSDLAHIRDFLISNPTEARELSFGVGAYINGLYTMAGVAVEQFERAERLRREKIREQEKKHQGTIMNAYFELIRQISNPIVISFAQTELDAIKSAIQLSDNDLSIGEMKLKIESIIKNAEKKAEEWKSDTITRQKKDNLFIRLVDAEKAILNEKIEDQNKTNEFIEKIKKLKEEVTFGTLNSMDIERNLNMIEDEVDETMITEEIRRETVKAIVRQLKKQEFSIKPPQIVESDNGSYVKIMAEKPSGRRAICKIDLHGRITYKFDQYEGMTCLKDIEKFNVDLQEVYSIKLSNERILWSNPDKLSRETENIPKNRGRNA